MYTVFIVDDEELVIKSLKASVDWVSCGFEVVGHALSGEEALSAIPIIQPDVIVSDIRMPGMNGLELMKHLSDSGITAKFMIISGLAEFALAQKAIKQRVFGYCLKPFDELEISGYLQSLKRELDGHHQLMEGDILDLIESGTSEAQEKLQQVLNKAGITEEVALRLMLTVRRDKLPILGKKPCLSLRIGYRKFVYLLAEQDVEELMSAMGTDEEVSKGIGLSKPFAEMTGIIQAIQHAELQAYQFFTLSSRCASSGPFELSDTSLDIPRLAPSGDVTAHIARLDAMLLMFQTGQRDIRHALLLFNDCISHLSRWGKEASDLFLYSFDQLADLFEDVREMIAYLKKLFSEEKTDLPVPFNPGRNQTFNAMLGHINEHYWEDISIQGMSKMFSVNANYISQIFRKELNKTFTEYLNSLRIERAASLLRSTSVPINEIADQVGYKDYFYFSKLFKKSRGVSPKSFRNDRP